MRSVPTPFRFVLSCGLVVSKFLSDAAAAAAGAEVKREYLISLFLSLSVFSPMIAPSSSSS